MPCSFERECALREQGIFFVAGVDEAGRGPLAGPVVAAAVIFLEHDAPDRLNDSKKLTAARRERLYGEMANADHILWAVSVQDARVIDQINILQATHRAMREAVRQLSQKPGHALIDGLPVRDFPVPQTALVGGDALSFSIAAASVLAKVTRDRIMLDAHQAFPQYGFDRHKGYGTKAHLDALRKHGPCPLHRMTFAPVAQTLDPGLL